MCRNYTVHRKEMNSEIFAIVHQDDNFYRCLSKNYLMMIDTNKFYENDWC